MNHEPHTQKPPNNGAEVASSTPQTRQWVLVAGVLVIAGVIGLLGPQWTGKAGGAAAIDPAEAPVRMQTREGPTSMLPLQDSLVGWWPGSFSADDIDGRFEVETVRGIEHAPGLVGAAFSATDQSAIILKPSEALRLPKFSLSAWVRAPKSTRGGRIATLQVGPATNFTVQLHGPLQARKHGRAQLGIGAEVLDGTIPLHDGEWHHLVATFDGTRARIFVDGKLDVDETRALRLPERGRGVLQLASADAQLDEIMLHERALTDDEIGRWTRAGKLGLVRAWTGDEAHPGHFNGTIGYDDGRFGFGYKLGGHGHIEVPASPALHLDRFTLAAWVRVRGDVAHHYAIFAKENHHCGAPWNHRNFYLGISPKFVLGEIGVTLFAPGARVGVKFPINDGKWHHVAATYDGNQATVLVDGKALARGPMKTPPVDDRQDLWLGGYGRASQPLRARMELDDAAIFDRALDAKALAALADPRGESAKER